MSRVATDIVLRPYLDEDEARVLELLDTSLGGGPAGTRPAAFFRWKHLENPFGRSYLLLAEAEGRVVGLRAFMRWEFRVGERTVRAVRAVDTATHPEHQGRGIFRRLTLRALEDLRRDADLVFNTPNAKSLPGYLKMGWREVGRVPVGVRVRRPVRFVRGLRSLGSNPGLEPGLEIMAETAAEALADGEATSELLGDAPADGHLATPRDLGYLRWRYATAPLLDYRAVREHEGGRLKGLAFFRVRSRGRLREATVAEILVADGDAQTARRLLRAVRASAPVDHLTCSFPSGSASARAARASGFVRAPGGMNLVVNPIAGGVEPDPTMLSSWALTLGDLEVF